MRKQTAKVKVRKSRRAPLDTETEEWLKDAWGLTWEESEEVRQKVENGENVQISIGCDTGIRSCYTLHEELEHGKKYNEGGEWIRYCTVCDEALKRVRIETYYDPEWEKVFFSVNRKRAVEEMEEIRRKYDEQIKKEEEREKEEKERTERILAEAKATNQKVKIREYTEDCDGSVEECSTDIIIEYATPDGKIEVERIHTY